MFCDEIPCQAPTKGTLFKLIFAKYQLEIIGLSLLAFINLFANCNFTMNNISYCSRMKTVTKSRIKSIKQCQEIKQNWGGRRNFGNYFCVIFDQ